MGYSPLRDKVFLAINKKGVASNRFRLTDHVDPVSGAVLRLFATAASGSEEEEQLFRDVEVQLQRAGFRMVTHWMPVAASTRISRHIAFTSAPD